MKIVFLCGSLEHGRDGVGDYVRQLAGELQRQGHQAAGVALNDPHIAQEVSPAPLADSNEVSVLRLPSCWSANRRFRRARQWVAAFNPVWISLQFVPYAFHAKGLPAFLSQQIGALTKGRQVHLMLHESWVGAEPGTGIKRWLVSHLQRAIVRNLIAGLKPTVIHTHLPLYRTRLQLLGWPALPLPLFSNIPVLETPIPPAQALDSPTFRVGIFSQADTSGPFVDFLISLATHLTQHHQQCQVLLMGGSPTGMQALKATLEGFAVLRDQVHYAGFLAPAQLSAALQTCHLGLTPVPRHGLGKSGTVAAFLAHGIPVAAPYVHSESTADDIGFFYADLRSSILRYPDIAHFQLAEHAAQVAKSTIQVSAIAQRFLADLITSSKSG